MPGEGLGGRIDDETAERLYGNDDGTVVAVGDFMVDKIVSMDHPYRDEWEDEDWFPRAGESVLVDSRPDMVEEYVAESFPGGRSPNQAVAAAQAGAETSLFSRVGYDSERAAHMAAKGVDLDRLEVDWETRNPSCYVFLDDEGDNRLTCFKEAGDMVEPGYVDRHYEGLSEAEYLLVSNGEADETLHELFSRLEEDTDRPTVVFDPAPTDGAGEMLEYGAVDYVTPNEVEYDQLVDELAACDADVIRTTADGAELNGEYFAEAPDVDVVDTTGAGDTFNGYLAGCLAQGRSLEESMEYAVHAASLSVTREGAQTAVPSMDEVESFLEAEA